MQKTIEDLQNGIPPKPRERTSFFVLRDEENIARMAMDTAFIIYAKRELNALDILFVGAAQPIRIYCGGWSEEHYEIFFDGLEFATDKEKKED
jgi:hypothetical protein